VPAIADGMKSYPYSDLTRKIIDACYEVHQELGPGFIEQIYHNALKVAQAERGLNYGSEKIFDVHFHQQLVGQHRLDLVVEEMIYVELKAVEGAIPEVFKAQVVSGLKASGLPVGLLVNFGNPSCEVKRLINPNLYQQ
jgi:GxxExxY protein